MSKLNTRKYDLAERTAQFGEAVLVFVRKLPSDVATRPLISQIVRSATSVGANYAEALDAESKSDFRHKVAICRKESKETIYWLRMIASVVPSAKIHSDGLTDEARQLNLIFGASLKTLANKEK